MATIRQKILPWFAILLAAVLVLVALFITMVRQYEGDYDYLRTLVEVQFEKDLQQEVYIRHFSINWKYLLPKFDLRGVQIGDNTQPESVLRVNAASIDVDWYTTLSTRRLSLDKVTLDGINVEVRRDKDGDIKINQTLLLPLLAGESRNYKVSSLFAIAVSNLSVHWLDEPLAIDYFFPSMTVNVLPNKKHSSLYVSVQLPSQLGKRLTIAANMKGRSGSWRQSDINLYIKSEELKLHELAEHIRSDSMPLPLNVSFEAWGEVSKGKFSGLTGAVSILDLGQWSENKYHRACHSQDYLRSVNGSFKWHRSQNDWTLQVGDLDVRSRLNDWPRGEVVLSQHNREQSSQSIVHVDYFESGAVCNTLAQLPMIGKLIDEKFGSYSGRVELWDSTALIDHFEGAISDYSVDLGDFTLSAKNHQSGQFLNGLAGNLLIGKQGGQLRFSDNANIQLSEPNFYAEQLLNATLAGELFWQTEALGWRIWSDKLHLENDDLELLNRFSLQMQNGQPYIDMQSVLKRATPLALAKYFPAHPKTLKTREWLQQSLVSGEVESAVSLFRGNLKSFPFNDKPGLFLVDAKVSNGQLNYRPGWPQVEAIDATISIRNDRLIATSNHAHILESKLQNVRLEIGSFKRAIASIRGEAKGQAGKLLDFLDQARLVDFDNSILKSVAVSGETSLYLEIDKPLSKKVKQETRVEGDLIFSGAAISIPPTGIHLKDIFGAVHFGRDGVAGERLSANLFNQPVSLSIQPTINGASTLSLSGPLDTRLYFKQRFPQLSEIVNGVTEVRANVGIPAIFSLRGTKEVSYQVHSNLHGVSIELPQPLGKSADEFREFEVYRPLDGNSIQIGMKNLIGLVMHRNTIGNYELKSVQLGPVSARNSYEKDALISGSIGRLDLQEWWQYWQSYSSDAGQSMSLDSLPDVHVEANSIFWGQSEFKDVNFQSEHQGGGYVLNIQSPDNRGNILIPVDYSTKDLPIELNFERLTLPAMTKAGSGVGLPTPTKIPLFNISARRLKLHESDFENVFIETSRIEQGIQFDQFNMRAQDLQIKANGKWRQLANAEINTDFVVNATSVDVEDSLVALGFVSAIGKGDAKVRADIRWSGSPLDFDLATSWADIDLSVWDGVIKHVDPGAGRFLALVNLGAIGRRLSLDFDDVTDEGFAFDSVIGKLSLRNSDLQIKDLTLLSPTADIVINGKTNVVKKTYDQNISVTPKFSGGLPVAGALLGGPIVGAAIIVADQITKSMGSDINKVSTVDYKLTGTWENPNFRKLIKPEPAKKQNANTSSYKTLPP